MIKISLPILIILAIAIAVVYSIFVIKKYPVKKRKAGYVKAVIVFIFFTLIFYGIFSIKFYANSVVNNYFDEIEYYVILENPNNAFVKNGFDIKEAHNDLSQLSSTIFELKALLPSHTELGVNKIVYDWTANYLLRQLQKRLNNVGKFVKTISTFADDKNVITVSSLTNGLKSYVNSIINRIALVIVIIFAFFFCIYIVCTLLTAIKESKRKRLENENAPSE